ncbi:Pr6Pr family membrane protein [Saccharopolyspora cebuensis]|uniref:Pr6Pr family membrane protein n=1 Tax=Saccharopolyspora cebuensis TaxID=418759 RepID=A0ABV4CSN3_9PSEU
MLRALAVLFRLAIAVIAVVGIVLTVGDGSFSGSLVYFTVQSNVLLAAAFAWSAVASALGRGHLPPALKGAVTVYILITGLVFNLVLVDTAADEFAPAHVQPASEQLGSDLLHSVTPVLAALDWLLFAAHRRLRWSHAALWLVYPFGYLAFAMIRGGFVDGPDRYPYPFIDVDALGYDGLLLNVVVYAVAFWLLGSALVLLDRLLPGGRSAPATPRPTADERAGSPAP